MRSKLVIAGGTGFLGTALVQHFAKRDCEVVILTRRPNATSSRVRQVAWDARSLGAWGKELESATAVINLAGRSVDCRYNTRNREEILHSRVESTAAVGQAISACLVPPRVWINASTATIYRHSLEKAMDEQAGEIAPTPDEKDEFSIHVAQAWEHALMSSAECKTRRVALRLAMVLGRGEHSVFPVLRRLVRIGLGGRMGSGRQYVSWIHELDFCLAVEFLIGDETLLGPVNLCSPNPIPNKEFMCSLREVCRMPLGLPAARWMLEAGAVILRTETELILKSRRVIPAKLQAAGFAFRYPVAKQAMEALVSHQ